MEGMGWKDGLDHSDIDNDKRIRESKENIPSL